MLRMSLSGYTVLGEEGLKRRSRGEITLAEAEGESPGTARVDLISDMKKERDPSVVKIPYQKEGNGRRQKLGKGASRSRGGVDTSASCQGLEGS